MRLVPLFNGVSFLFCCFLKVLNELKTNELKNLFFLNEQKSQGYLYKTGQNFVAGKTLVWLAYVGRTATAKFFQKRSNI